MCSLKFWIKFITKTYSSQGSDTNLELNTCPLPMWVGLLTFRTIRFFPFRYEKRIVNYMVLTQAVSKINLIKLSHSQENIFIIFIPFLSGEFQCWHRHKDENVGHSNELPRWEGLSEFRRNYVLVNFPFISTIKLYQIAFLTFLYFYFNFLKTIFDKKKSMMLT